MSFAARLNFLYILPVGHPEHSGGETHVLQEKASARWRVGRRKIPSSLASVSTIKPEIILLLFRSGEESGAAYMHTENRRNMTTS